MEYNITDLLVVTYLLNYNIYLKYYADLSWVCLVGTCIVDVLILDKRTCILSIEKFWEIIYCKTQSEHAYSDRCVWLAMHYFFSFNTCCRSVNGPTLGDYKLQNPIEPIFISLSVLRGLFQYCDCVLDWNTIPHFCHSRSRFFQSE